MESYEETQLNERKVEETDPETAGAMPVEKLLAGLFFTLLLDGIIAKLPSLFSHLIILLKGRVPGESASLIGPLVICSPLGLEKAEGP